DGAIGVADRFADEDRLAALYRLLAKDDPLVVERLGQAVILGPCAIDIDVGVRLLGRREDRREIDPLRLPVLDRLVRLQAIDAANHLVERAEAELGHDLPSLLGDQEEEIDHMLGLSGEALPQYGVLR